MEANSSPDRDVSLTDSIVSLFERHVERFPENIAILIEGGQITYNALNSRANFLARVLRNVHSRKIALCFSQGATMIDAMLGVLKSGNAYVLLNPGIPTEQSIRILADSGASIMITNLAEEKILPVVSALGTGFEIILYNGEGIGNHKNVDKLIHPHDHAVVHYQVDRFGELSATVQNHHDVLCRVPRHQGNGQDGPTNQSNLIPIQLLYAGTPDIFSGLLSGTSLQLVDATDDLLITKAS